VPLHTHPAATFDLPDVGIAVLDDRGAIRQANPLLTRWALGDAADPDGLAGRPLAAVAAGQDGALASLVASAATVGREVSGPVTLGAVGLWVRVTPSANGALIVARELTDAERGGHREVQGLEGADLVMAASLDGLWGWDLLSGEVWASPAFARMLGYEASEYVPDYAVYTARIHDDDRARVDAALKEHFERGRPYSAEYRIRRRDGAWRWHLSRGVSIRDAGGRVIRMAGVTTDVTDWREAEGALRESEARFRSLATSAPLGIFLADAAGRVVYANPRLLSMFEARYEQLLDGSFFGRIHPLDRARADASWARAVRTAGESQERYRLLGGSGRIRWVEGRTAPIRGEDGQVIGHIGLVSDVTERHEAEAALEASETRFRTLAEESPIGIYQLGSDAQVAYLNRAAHRILEVTASSGLPEFFSRVHPDDVPELRARTERLLQREAMGEVTFRLTTAEGGVRWIRARSAAIDHPDGGVAGRIGTLEDITEARAAEAARREIEQRIQHAQKLESLGVLAGGIAHDFNNLLVGILGNASLAMLDLPAESPARDAVLQIQTAAERSADLTRQLLAYAGKGQFEIRPEHLTRLVTDILPLLQAALSKRVELRHEFAAQLAEVRGDPAQLTQVVMNLLTNASDAIGDRTGVVSLRTRERLLAREDLAGMALGVDLPPGPYVGLEVEDSGDGMDEATLGRIFEPFFTTKFTGRGLGLAAVLGIVRSHRGALRVTSVPARGTCFEVWLPGGQDVVDAPIAGRVEVPVPDGGGLVLVADDEPAVRQVARKFLERWGYEVLEAADGLEALALAEREGGRLHLVLLDITMPRKDGVETFRELRQVSRTLPVVLMSGFTEQAAATDLGSLGRALFIQKPFKGDDLRRTIAQAIHGAGQ
jgi:two-component system cell cycle sensor histidine kinase/response regulator CckA